ncbi:MAG: hypothetical protein J7M38_06235 [Armatimonadetes bacterium]|nr:hypothetical protein [Armatimonadota bacterium]
MCPPAGISTSGVSAEETEEVSAQGRAQANPQAPSLDNHGAHVVGYDIKAEITPSDHTIDATARMDWSGAREVDAVSFELRPSLKISRIIAPDGSEAKYDRNAAGRVTVPVKGLGRIFYLIVHYSGVINGPRGGANNQRLWDCIGPGGTYVRFEAGWYPRVPGDRAVADLHLTVPAGWTPVTSGQLVGQDGNTWHWHVTRPAAGLSFTAAPYAVTESMTGEIPIQVYTFPEHRRRAGEFIDICGRILAFCEELYGDYPFGKFAVAEIPDSYGGGHGDQGFIMLSESLLEGPLDSEFIAHEMTHNWWGNLIQCIESEFPAEGFATYSQALWREHEDGPAGLQAAMREQAEAVLLASLAPAEEISCFKAESGPLLYEKGAWILHMLRHQVGDRVFFQTVRRFATEHADEVITCRDLQHAFEDAWGRPLDWFFDQWLYGTGVPWVTGEVVDEPGNQVRVKLRQREVLGEGDPDSAAPDDTWRTRPGNFRLLVDVKIRMRDGSEVARSFTMTLPEQDFIFVAPGEPAELVIDPDCRLLDHSKGLVGELDDDMQRLDEQLRRELGAPGG